MRLVRFLAPVRLLLTIAGPAPAAPADDLARDLIPPLKAIVAALEKFVSASQPAPADPDPAPQMPPDDPPAESNDPPPQPDPMTDPLPEPSTDPGPPVLTVKLREALAPNPYPAPVRDYKTWPKLKPSFRDVPSIAPELSQPAPKVNPTHPRLLITPENRDEMQARFGDFPALAKPIIAAVDDTRLEINQRATCAAAIYAVGLSPKLKYTHTREEYGTLARQFLLSATLPVNTDGKMDHFLQCFVFDWIYDLLSPDERATVIKRYEDQQLGDWNGELWLGYNCNAGLGMIPALAFHGDAKVDYVGQYWLSWWTYGFEGKSDQRIPSICNRAWEKYIHAGKPFQREGLGYYTYSVIHQVMRRAYETATGDETTLDYDWYNVIPQYLATSLDLASGRPQSYRANVDSYNSGLLANYYAPCTGAKDPRQGALSRWLHDQSGKAYTTNNSWPGTNLIVRMIVGNPRIVGKPPGELGFPTTNFVNDQWTSRSDWTPDADCIIAQSSEILTRATATRNIGVWSKGKLLIGYGHPRWNHGYAPSRSFMSTINVYDKAGKCVTTVSGANGSDSGRTRIYGSVTCTGTTAVLDYGAWHKVGITGDAICTVTHDKAGRVATITDTLTCAAPYVARITFCTPLEPKWDGTTLRLQNESAKAELTFDPPLAECVIRGGYDPTPARTDLTQRLFGQDYDGTIDLKSLVGDFTAKPTDPANEADRRFKGGYFTVFLAPAVGADGKINQTTIVTFK